MLNLVCVLSGHHSYCEVKSTRAVSCLQVSIPYLLRQCQYVSQDPDDCQFTTLLSQLPVSIDVSFAHLRMLHVMRLNMSATRLAKLSSVIVCLFWCRVFPGICYVA